MAHLWQVDVIFIVTIVAILYRYNNLSGRIFFVSPYIDAKSPFYKNFKAIPRAVHQVGYHNHLLNHNACHERYLSLLQW